MSIKSSVIHAAGPSSVGSISGFVRGTTIITILTLEKRKKEMFHPKGVVSGPAPLPVQVDRAWGEEMGGPVGPPDGGERDPSQKWQAKDPDKHTCLTFLTKFIFGLVYTSYVPQTYREKTCLDLIDSFLTC